MHGLGQVLKWLPLAASVACVAAPQGEMAFDAACGSCVGDAGRIDGGRTDASRLDASAVDATQVCENFESPFPDEGLVVLLRWYSGGDMDLHVISEGLPGQFAFASPRDCYYANCRTPTPNSPWWDTSFPPQQGGNPRLTSDALMAPAFEAVIVPEPVPGKYQIIVDYFKAVDEAPSERVKVDVFQYDQHISCLSKEVVSADRWPAGIASVRNGVVSILQLDGGTP